MLIFVFFVSFHSPMNFFFFGCLSVVVVFRIGRRLVKLAARAFYDDITTKGENQPKNGRSDNRGIAVVILDALSRFLLLKPFFHLFFLKFLWRVFFFSVLFPAF